MTRLNLRKIITHTTLDEDDFCMLIVDLEIYNFLGLSVFI
jgi:hypothetical protein